MIWLKENKSFFRLSHPFKVKLCFFKLLPYSLTPQATNYPQPNRFHVRRHQAQLYPESRAQPCPRSRRTTAITCRHAQEQQLKRSKLLLFVSINMKSSVHWEQSPAQNIQKHLDGQVLLAATSCCVAVILQVAHEAAALGRRRLRRVSAEVSWLVA